MADEEENETVEEEETEESEEPSEDSEEDDDDSEEDDDDSEEESDDDSEEESGDDSEEDSEGDSEDDSEKGGDNRSVLAKKTTPKRRKKTGSKKRGSKTTAGQRLAAAKAAKAAKKAAARGKQAELVEDEAMARAEKAAGWLEQNRSKLVGAALAVMVAIAGFFVFSAYQQGQGADASALLWQATQTLNAPIGEDETASEDDEASDDERYDTIGERADAALTPLNELLSTYGSTDLAPWAQLLKGRALYQKGAHEDARAAFSAALSGGSAGGGADIAPRAIEGIAFAYEAEENWDEAVSRFEELRSDDDDSLSILADYHLARIHIARDQEEEAKEKLQAVLNALREEDAPELPFVRDQAELRLMAIDSSLVQRSAPDQDEMRRLIEQLQQQQGAGGAGGG